jgi:tetratricopeptide (TPR) repeat protein
MGMRTTSLVSVLATLFASVAIVGAQPAPADSQTPPPAPAPTPAPPAPAPPSGPASNYVSPIKDTGDAKLDAKAHYDQGLTHYNLGEFDKAIVEFKAAYAISNATGLLFNIAQAYRLLKQFEQASYFYKTFLRLKPEAPNRADVEQRIEEMDKAIAEQKAIQDAKPREALPPEGENKAGDNKPVQPQTPVTVNINNPNGGEVIKHEGGGGGSMKTAGIATAGAGGALLLTGLVFGALASGNQNDLNKLNNGGTWTSASQDKYDAGKRDNTIAVICFVAGGAAVVTGGVLFGLGTLKDRDGGVAVVPTTHGAQFVAGWKF